MIRPLTIATCLLACGSGLYLYQEKHEVQLLDRTIERTVKDTGALREQSRLLAAEWTMLNDPERLRQFSDSYLNVKTISPTQFTSLADLDSRLPAAQPEVSSHGPDQQEAVPVASATDSPGEAEADAATDAAPPAAPLAPAPAVADEEMPVPPIPRTAAVASASHPASGRPVFRTAATDGQSRAVADAHGSDQHPWDQRPNLDQRPPLDQRVGEQHVASRSADARADPRADARADPRADARADPRADARADARADSRTTAAPPRPIILAARRPLPANSPAYNAQAYNTQGNQAPTPSRQPMVTESAPSTPYGGSLLGMARGSMPPAPRPTPVSATYNSN
jgi:hypothetical protein